MSIRLLERVVTDIHFLGQQCLLEWCNYRPIRELMAVGMVVAAIIIQIL